MKLKNLKYKHIFFWAIAALLFVIFADQLILHLRYDFRGIINEKTRIILLKNSEDTKRLTIYENEEVAITIGNDQYTSYLNSNKKGTVNYSDIERYYGEIKFAFDRGFIPKVFPPQKALVVEMLKSGQATVYDKQTKKNAVLIVQHDIEFYCGPMCGWGSLNFYTLSGKLIFETGWIS